MMLGGYDHPNEPPSIEDQCAERGWPMGFFRATHTVAEVYHMNSSITRHNGKCYYCVRLTDWKSGTAKSWRDLYNETWIAELDHETMQVTPIHEVGHIDQRRHPKEQCEDSRLFSTSQGLMMSSSVWIPIQKYLPHQALMHLDEKTLKVRTFSQPRFGNNYPEIEHRYQKPEKNWLWFESSEGCLSMIYHHTPHTVCHLVDPRGAVFEVFTSQPPDWEWGELRGGTPPVCWRGQWLTVAHSSFRRAPAPFVPGWGYALRYVMPAIRFSPDPPHQITAISETLLTGSMRSVCTRNHGPAVFPGGVILDGDVATIAFGVNDTSSAWVKARLTDLKWRVLQPDGTWLADQKIE